MKKQYLLPLFSAAGGVMAFLLRLLQKNTGFEAATGLPVAGNAAAIALVVFLPACAAILVLLSRRIPQGTAPSFPANFSTKDARLLTLPVMGILLMGLSGLLDALSILSPDMVPGRANLSPQAQLIFAATALLSALALFSSAAACRQHGDREQNATLEKKVNLSLLLVPPVCLVIRLVMAYRIYSIDPVLARYYVELLALVFLTLAFYRLSSFAFQSGRLRRFAVYAGAAVILCIASLAESRQPADLLLYAGGALTLLGFLLLGYQQDSDT